MAGLDDLSCYFLRCVFLSQKKQNVLLPNCVSVRANKTFASTAFIIITIGHHITSIYVHLLLDEYSDAAIGMSLGRSSCGYEMSHIRVDVHFIIKQKKNSSYYD